MNGVWKFAVWIFFRWTTTENKRIWDRFPFSVRMCNELRGKFPFENPTHSNVTCKEWKSLNFAGGSGEGF